MDIKSFRKFVLESPIKEKLENIEVVLNYSYINSSVNLKGIQNIYKFILDQVKGWNSKEDLPSYFLESKTHFENLKGSLVGLTDFFDSEKNHQFDNQWNLFHAELIRQRLNYSNRNYIFLYDSPEVDFLINIAKRKPNQFQGALEYFTQPNININNNRDYFSGALAAYEFKSQEDSEILQRRHNEKISLSHIRTKYNEHIVEAEQQLNGFLSDAKENLTNHFSSMDLLKSEKNKDFMDWFEKNQEDFNSFYDTAKDNVISNEDLYREKLRLEAPAKYWRDRSEKLKNESNNYLDWLIRISLFSSLLLFILLISLGNNFYENVFNDNIKGIKWSLILITIISILAFIIRIFAKLYMSSLHLSRDAEEREQLTHFYLALIKDTQIKDEERQLILQSLFSRADTGLLKEDSSPTMPTSIIEKFSSGK